jgi:hypothetical protein
VEKPKRTFNYYWGSGVVEEEAQVEGQYHLPTIQLLRFTDGEAEGEVSIRFCHYDHRGRFQRSPLLMSMDDIEMMREALRAAPELRESLRKLVED